MSVNHNIERCYGILDKDINYRQGVNFVALDTNVKNYVMKYKNCLQVQQIRATVFNVLKARAKMGCQFTLYLMMYLNRMQIRIFIDTQIQLSIRTCLKSMELIIGCLHSKNTNYHQAYLYMTTKTWGASFYVPQTGQSNIVKYVYDYASLFLRQIKRWFNNVTDSKHLIDPYGLNTIIPTIHHSTSLSV